jgi:hypothetical protein
MENYEQAVDAYQMAILHCRAAENLVAEMLSTSGLALLAFEHGQLHLAFEIAAPVCAPPRDARRRVYLLDQQLHLHRHATGELRTDAGSVEGGGE